MSRKLLWEIERFSYSIALIVDFAIFQFYHILVQLDCRLDGKNVFQTFSFLVHF